MPRSQTKTVDKCIEKLPSGAYRVRVRAAGGFGGGGRTMSSTHRTLTEARKARAALLARIGAEPMAGDRLTLRWYFGEMFLPGRSSLANVTLSKYRSIWRTHIEPAFGSRPISSIKSSEVQRWLYTKPRGTASKCVSTLRAIMRQAYADEVIDREPLRGTLRLPGQAPAPLPVWSAEDVAAAMPVLRGTPLYRLWLVMVGGGAGREEAYALYERDLAYTRDGGGTLTVTATVDDAVTPEDGRKAPKNPHRYRVIAIAEPFASELLATRAESPDEPLCRYSVGNLPRKWAEMWRERKPGVKYPSTSCVGIMLDAGVPFVQLGRMRATHETLAQLAGVPDTLNAAMHGRSNVNTGYRHYLVPGGDAMRGAAEGVGRMVSGGSAGPR